MSEENQSDQNNKFSFESYQHIDSDYQLPKSTVTQLIQDNLPSNAKMSNQTKDLIIALSMCYLNHLASCANNVCNQKEKKTILPEHVYDALINLKMDAYIDDILQSSTGDMITPSASNNRAQLNTDFSKVSDKQKKALILEKLQKTDQAQRKKFRKMHAQANDNGMTEEQLLEEQNRLFAQAKSFEYANAASENNHLPNANYDYSHNVDVSMISSTQNQSALNGQPMVANADQDAVMIDTSTTNGQQQKNGDQNQQEKMQSVKPDQIDQFYAQIPTSMERVRFAIDNTDFMDMDQEDDDLIPSVKQQFNQL